MTDAQLYLAIGMPSVVALIGILVNIGYFIVLNQRMTGLETDMKEFFRLHTAHDQRIQRLEDKKP